MSAKKAPVPSNDPTLLPLSFQAGGALGLDALYVERRADTQLFDVLRQGNLCHVLAPRQMGKSSLLLRAKDKLLRQGWLCIDLDLQIFATDSENQFYSGVMDRLARELGLYWDAVKFRQRHLDSPLSYLWVSFLIDHLLPARRKHLAIFVDDTDILTRRPFGASEFLFGLRTAIERSAQLPAPAGEQRALFSVCLAGVMQPLEPTRDGRGSLFEISRAIDLVDFTGEESRQLLPALSRLSLYALPQVWLDAVLDWTGGHPYLTQRLCADLADAIPTPPRGFRPQKDDGRKLVRKEVADRVHRLFMANREGYVQSIKDELEGQRGTHTYRDLLSLYRRVYINSPGRLIEFNPNDLVQQYLLLRCLVKKQLQEQPGASTSKTILVLRNKVFREIFGVAWMAQQEHPALAKFSDKMIAFFQSQEADKFALTYAEAQMISELSYHHELSLGRDFTTYIARSEASRRSRRIFRSTLLVLLTLCALTALVLVERRNTHKKLLGQKRENSEREEKAREKGLRVLTAKVTELEEQLSSLNATIGTFSTEEKTVTDQIELQKQKIRLLRDSVTTLDKLVQSAKKNAKESIKALRQKLNETADSLQQRNTVLAQRVDELKLRASGQQALQKRRSEELTTADRDLEAALVELAAKPSPDARGLLALLSQASKSVADIAAGKTWPLPESARELRLTLEKLGSASVTLPFVERSGVDGERVALCPQTTAEGGAFVSLDGPQLHLWTAATLESTTKKPLLLGATGEAQYAAAMGACSRGVVATASGKLATWDGKSVRPVKAPAGLIRLLALVPAPEGEQPEGTPLVLGSGGSALSRFLLKDPALKSAGEPLVHEAAVTRAVLARDGASVLSAADRRLYLWDFVTGKPLASKESGHGAAITALALSLYDEGSTVLSGSSEGEIKKWTRSKEGLLPRRTMLVHQGAVQDAVLAERGRYIISAGSDGYVIWTDPRDGRLVYKLGPFGPSNSIPKRLAISSDGSRLLVGFLDRVRLYHIGDRDFLRLACQTLQGRAGVNPDQLRAACDPLR